MKRLLLLGVCLLVLPLGVAAEASAAHSSPEYFYEGTFGPPRIGHRHTLFEVSARVLSPNGFICVNALNDSDQLVGGSACSLTLAVHNYCNCAWRRGYAHPDGPTTNARAREDF
jgi:hypothetical protein